MTEYADIVEGGFSFKFNADFQVVQMILLYLYFREMAYYWLFFHNRVTFSSHNLVKNQVELKGPLTKFGYITKIKKK